MLSLKGVWRMFKSGQMEVAALQDASLDIEDGAFVAIVGPSGSGKSTLLQLIGLVDRPTRGSIVLDGREVGAMSDADRTALRLRRIGFVFQRFHLISDLTAIENVTLPMEAAGIGVQERFGRARTLLQSMGLETRLNFRPSQLSGGQRQRVAIARSVANRPGMVLADEPTGELHSEDRSQVIDLFKQLQREGHTIVVVTHDETVAEVADRQVRMRDGRIERVA